MAETITVKINATQETVSLTPARLQSLCTRSILIRGIRLCQYHETDPASIFCRPNQKTCSQAQASVPMDKLFPEELASKTAP